MEMDDSWSLGEVVRECARKAQLGIPDDEEGVALNTTTAAGLATTQPATTTVVGVGNYLSNPYPIPNQFNASNNNINGLQNSLLFGGQFNNVTAQSTTVAEISSYLNNPYPLFGRSYGSTYSTDQFNSNGTSPTNITAHLATVANIDNYLPTPFPDQFGASNSSTTSSSQFLQMLEKQLLSDDFDANVNNNNNNNNNNNSFQNLLMSDQFDPNNNNNQNIYTNNSGRFGTNVSNTVGKALPPASSRMIKAGGNACGHNLKDLCQPFFLSPPLLPSRGIRNPGCRGGGGGVAVIEPPQDYREVKSDEHLFLKKRNFDQRKSCYCPDGLYCGHGKKRKGEDRKVSILTAEELASHDDGWAWRKYGQKPIKGSVHPRSYYKCSSKSNCLAKKHVEQISDHPEKYVITYSGNHFHPCPPYRANGGTRPKATEPGLDPSPETESPDSVMATALSSPSGSAPGSGSGSGSAPVIEASLGSEIKTGPGSVSGSGPASGSAPTTSPGSEIKAESGFATGSGSGSGSNAGSGAGEVVGSGLGTGSGSKLGYGLGTRDNVIILDDDEDEGDKDGGAGAGVDAANGGSAEGNNGEILIPDSLADMDFLLGDGIDELLMGEVERGARASDFDNILEDEYGYEYGFEITFSGCDDPIVDIDKTTI